MQENGWIKLHRSILKWEWYDDVNTKAVFLHLMLTANVEDSKWHGIEVKRGSVITSYAKLAKAVGISVQQARTALEHLESTHELTRQSHNNFTVISIKNYDRFQTSTHDPTNGQQSNNTRSTNDQHTSNNSIRKYKNKKNNKNVDKCSSNTHYTAQQISEIVAYLGYRWSNDEIQAFIAFNEARGWKLTPEEGIPKWERQRQRQVQSGWRSKYDKPMTEKEIEEMNAYQALSKRFKKD